MVRKTSLAVLAAALVAGAVGMAPREASARKAACCTPTKEVTVCVDDPCDCCPGQEACVCIPCCCNEDPCVTWRDGLLGRRIATYTWKCCCFSVDIVVTRKGDLIVRQ